METQAVNFILLGSFYHGPISHHDKLASLHCSIYCRAVTWTAVPRNRHWWLTNSEKHSLKQNQVAVKGFAACCKDRTVFASRQLVRHAYFLGHGVRQRSKDMEHGTTLNQTGWTNQVAWRYAHVISVDVISTGNLLQPVCSRMSEDESTAVCRRLLCVLSPTCLPGTFRKLYFPSFTPDCNTICRNKAEFHRTKWHSLRTELCITSKAAD